MSTRSLLLLFYLYLTNLVAGQVQSVLKPTAPAPSATAVAGGFGYSYIGCWGSAEAGDVNRARVLAGGRYIFRKGMTTAQCLDFCSTGKSGQAWQYAGLSNGRGCWCSQALLELSERLNDSRCNRSCNGNSSEICGGSNALTLYDLTELDYKTGRARSQFSEAAGYGTLAVILLVIAAIL